MTFKGELWTVSEGARERFDLRWIFGADAGGLAPTLDRIHTGKNSGYQAIGLAYVFGAARVVLLGFDFMVGPKGEHHWHGNHPKGLGNGGAMRYATWSRCMDVLANDLKRTDCVVVNASRRTALRCFQRVTLEDALDELRDPVRVRHAGGV